MTSRRRQCTPGGRSLRRWAVPPRSTRHRVRMLPGCTRNMTSTLGSPRATWLDLTRTATPSRRCLRSRLRTRCRAKHRRPREIGTGRQAHELRVSIRINEPSNATAHESVLRFGPRTRRRDQPRGVRCNHLRSNHVYAEVGSQKRLEELVDNATDRGGWLLFYTHDVSTNPSPFGCTPDDIERLASRALDKGAKLLAVREVMARLTHLPKPPPTAGTPPSFGHWASGEPGLDSRVREPSSPPQFDE